MSDLASAGLQSRHGFLMRDLDSHRVTELMMHAKLRLGRGVLKVLNLSLLRNIDLS